MYLKILAGILLLGLTACATTIGNRNDLQSAEFKINQTTKSEVSAYLGLPAKISTDQKEKKQYWYYTEGAKLSGLILPVLSTSGGSVSASTSALRTGMAPSDLDYAVMFVFNEQDVLIEVSK